jgi:glycosyltransferase involved in cell wall biosynthesis
MKIVYVVARPTQFEAPFFRFAARDPRHELRVIFTDSDPAGAVFDAELGRTIDWGIDLTGGYSYEQCPSQGRAAWFRARLGREACDLLITNGYTSRVYVGAAVTARRARVATGLRLDSVPRSGLARFLLKRALFALALRPMYDVFFATGSLTMRYLRAMGVPRERTALFPYAVDVEHFRVKARISGEQRRGLRARLGVPPAAKVVLSLAKFIEREAPWDLLRAFANDAGTDVWLVLAGDGPQRRDLEGFAAQHGHGRVRFPGYVPYRELPASYAAADLFVHPAREERWGVSVAEALACGLPVIASLGVGAAADLVVTGQNGYTYQAGSCEELSRVMLAGLDLDRERVRRHSEGILAKCDYRATWESLVAAAERMAGQRAA